MAERVPAPARPRRPRLCATFWLAALLTWAAGPGVAQDATASAETTDRPPLQVIASHHADAWVAGRSRLSLVVSHPLPPGERLAVFIGSTDVTALFTATSNGAYYQPTTLPLAPGEAELVVHHVSAAGAWSEVARLPLRVLTRRGFRQAQTDPRFEISNTGQLAHGGGPDAGADGRGAFQDFTFNAGLSTRHARHGLTLTSRANVLGVSREEQALRFGQLAGDAPRWDLADYVVTLTRGSAEVLVGHASFGRSRHLLQGHASRGATGTIRFGEFGDIAAAVLGASNVTGWSNPFGLDEPAHRMAAVNLGFDMLAVRPGTARVDVALMHGSRLPFGAFDRGAVTDAEEGRGGSLSLRTATASQRLQLDAGVSLSRFRNPDDPLLSQGSLLVPVVEATRQARYLDATATLLQGRRLLGRLDTSVNAAYRHERVDPLYRSIAASTQADVERHTWEMSGSVGALAVQLSHTRMRDNLAEIPAVLTSLTRGTQANLAAPLASLLGLSRAPAWLPQANYSLSRTHQFGEGVPDDPEFAPGHVPDQVSLSHGLGLQWQVGRLNTGYQLSRSTQDNRQAGREEADFGTWTHQANVGVAAHASLDLGLDFGWEAAENREFEQTGYNTRGGGSLEWRPWRQTGLSVSYSVTGTHDEPRTGTSRIDDLNVQISQGFHPARRWGRGSPGRVFVRFARQGSESVVEQARDRRSTWTLQSGASLTLF